MQLNLRIKEGGWGEGPNASTDIMEPAARSVIGTFSPGLDRECRLNILLEQNEQPRAVSKLSDTGEFIIHVAGPGDDWFKLTFELGHEFTHVLVGPLEWQPDRFAWFEECLADTGSLFALHGLAASWKAHSPRPNWDVNHSAFLEHAAKYLAEPGRSLDEGATLKQWLTDNLPLLEQDHTLRKHNTIVARHLFPLFESNPSAWRAIRYFRKFERPEGMTFAQFLKSWRDACPDESQGTVDSIAEILGVSYPASKTRLRRRPATALLYMAAIKSAMPKPRPMPRERPRPAASRKTRRPGPSSE